MIFGICPCFGDVELGEPNRIASEWSDDVTSPEAQRTSRANPQCNHQHDSGGQIQNRGSWR